MTKRQYNRMLAQALDELAPADGFDRVAEALPYRLPRTATRRSGFHHARTLAVAAACLLLVTAALGGVLYATRQTVDAVIDIDVNPSIELAVDRADCVLTATAVNDDGAAVLKGLSVTDVPLEEAVHTIFDAMVARGYVSEDTNHILITVQNADAKRAARLREETASNVGDALARHERKAAIAKQTLTSFDEASQFAKRHGISNGKAAFILALTKQAPSLDATWLASCDFGALAVVAEQNGVDLQLLVDYDATDSAWGEIQTTLEQQVEQAEEALGIPLLTLEQAKEIALSGFDEEFQASAVFVVTEFGWEGDIPAYHLEFISQQSAVYCYVINAVDGSDLPTEYEKEQASTTPPKTMVSGGGTVTASRPTGSSTTTTTATTTTTTRRPTTPPTRNPHALAVVNIVDEAEENGWGSTDAIEPFYVDSEYIYYYGSGAPLAAVFADGSRKPLGEALEDGDVLVTDMDRFGFRYFKTKWIPRFYVKPNTAKNVPDWFYEDESYIYYFRNEIADYAYLICDAGDEAPSVSGGTIKHALRRGLITIDDFVNAAHDIGYYRVKKDPHRPSYEVGWVSVSLTYEASETYKPEDLTPELLSKKFGLDIEAVDEVDSWDEWDENRNKTGRYRYIFTIHLKEKTIQSTADAIDSIEKHDEVLWAERYGYEYPE